MGAVSRNEPCPCGSGLKYKRCCIDKKKVMGRKGWLFAAAFVAAAVGLSVGIGYGYGWKSGLGTATASLLLGGILYVVRSPPPSSGKGGGASDINFGR
jgi:hypothetical protein